ncbi:MAG: hypothetical protein Q4C47_05775 [Planctomycetia bacterium]|nr:hypothetical protein [Planctomycetia bacterium]
MNLTPLTSGTFPVCSVLRRTPDQTETWFRNVREWSVGSLFPGDLSVDSMATEAMGSWYGFSLFLGVAALLMAWSVRNEWNRRQREENDPKELRFFRGVFFRRIQMAALLGLVAILLPTGPVFFLKTLMGKIIYVCVILWLVVWMILMAIADMLVSRFRHQRLQDQVIATRLRVELEARERRKNADRGNGQNSESDRTPGSDTPRTYGSETSAPENRTDQTNGEGNRS